MRAWGIRGWFWKSKIGDVTTLPMISAQWGQRMLNLDRDVTFRLAVQHGVGMTQGNKEEPQLILNL